MQEIIPKLWLGPFNCSKDFNALKRANITHILIVRDPGEKRIINEKFPNNFKYKVIEASDNPLENIIRYFPNSSQWIENSLKKENGTVLVHCSEGISRAPAFVIAYLIEALEMSYYEAYLIVQNKRFCINPNEGYKLQLRVEYEPICRARQQSESLNYTDQQKSRQGERRRKEPDEGQGGASERLVNLNYVAFGDQAKRRLPDDEYDDDDYLMNM
ncbi:hypothetical protein HDU92_001302 [Lobulomyces angularis]|nr:hypothetical protein HDU92_001302 [Lobulomyces angularis]